MADDELTRLEVYAKAIAKLHLQLLTANLVAPFMAELEAMTDDAEREIRAHNVVKFSRAVAGVIVEQIPRD